MLKKILLGFAVVITGFLAYVGMKSGDFSISRDILIPAAPEVIFPHLNNSQKANEWMPWAASDPGVQLHFSGPAEGLGSTTTWDSKGSMGTGKAVVVFSTPTVVKTYITYEKPMKMEQMAEIAMTPATGGTNVKWTVTGKNSFMGRIFSTFVNLDTIVGVEFEKGLAKLKATVLNESAAVKK